MNTVLLLSCYCFLSLNFLPGFILKVLLTVKHYKKSYKLACALTIFIYLKM